MAPAIPYIIMAVSTGLTVAGQIQQGKQAKAMGQIKKQQGEANAKTIRAQSQRAAFEERRRAGLAASKAQAVGAASGGGAMSGDVVHNVSGFEEVGDFNARQAAASGESQARSAEFGGDLAKFEGDSAKVASNFAAASTIASSAGSAWGKYADGPAPTTKTTTVGTYTPHRADGLH